MKRAGRERIVRVAAKSACSVTLIPGVTPSPRVPAYGLRVCGLRSRYLKTHWRGQRAGHGISQKELRIEVRRRIWPAASGRSWGQDKLSIAAVAPRCATMTTLASMVTTTPDREPTDHGSRSV